MGKIMLRISAVIIVAFLVPYLLTMLISGAPLKVSQYAGQNLVIQSDVFKTGKAYTLDDYIMSALAANISLDSEMETLKAQAVIIRTMVYYTLNEVRADNQEAKLTLQELGLNLMTMEELKNQYEDEIYNEYVSKLENAVYSTKGQVLMYDHGVILPYFHYSNAGQTRSYEEAFGQKIPYLVSVPSANDVEASVANYTSEVKVGDAIKQLEKVFSIEGLTDDNFFSSISISKRDATGYVKEVKIGDTSVKGEEFQEVFSLNSTNFYMENSDGKIRFVCKGKGSGLGFSQYGANCLAEDGNDYTTLLTYYFTGVSVTEKEGEE